MKKFWIMILVPVLGGALYFVSADKKEGSNDDMRAEGADLASTDKKTGATSVQANPVWKRDSVGAGEFREMSVEDSFYSRNEYLKPFMSDEVVAASFYRAKELFKDSPNAEHIAVWISLGSVLDSDPKYGELLEYSIGKINENGSFNISLFENAVKTMGPEDSFIRGQLINMVNHMNVQTDDKIRFFGGEISRPAMLDSEGRWSPDSLNITTALIMLKNNNAPKDDVIRFMKESLRANQDDVIKDKLLTRFATYYPESVHELK